MKKVVCLVTLLALCLSFFAIAQATAVPYSPLDADLWGGSVEEEESDHKSEKKSDDTAVASETPADTTPAGLTPAADQASADTLVADIIAALANVTDPAEKNQVISQKLNVPMDVLKNIVGEGEMTVAEVKNFDAKGLENSTGPVKITLDAPTNLAEGTKVAVVITINGVVTVLEGTVVNGKIEVELPLDIVNALVANGGQIAIVCNTANVA